MIRYSYSPYSDFKDIKNIYIKGRGKGVANGGPDKQLLPTGVYNLGNWKTPPWNSYVFIYGYEINIKVSCGGSILGFVEKVIIEKDKKKKKLRDGKDQWEWQQPRKIWVGAQWVKENIYIIWRTSLERVQSTEQRFDIVMKTT